MDELPRDIVQIVYRYVHKVQLGAIHMELIQNTSRIKTMFECNYVVPVTCSGLKTYFACKKCKQWYMSPKSLRNYGDYGNFLYQVKQHDTAYGWNRKWHEFGCDGTAKWHDFGCVVTASK